MTLPTKILDDWTTLQTDITAALDSAHEQGLNDQGAVDAPVIGSLNAQVSTLTAELAAATAPPAAAIAFGLNAPASYKPGVFLPTAENAQQINARLQKSYPNFEVGKTFPDSVPTSQAASTWASYPTVKHMTFALGTYSAGYWQANAAKVVAFAKTLAPGCTADFNHNEVDADLGTDAARWAEYAAGVTFLHDALESAGVADKVQASICTMTSDNARFEALPTLLKGVRVHEMVLDGYLNHYPADGDGSDLFDMIDSVMGALGVPWRWGECGDRRPGSGSGAFPDDATRASTWRTVIARLHTMKHPPLSVCWFNRNGSSGNHIQDPSADPLTVAMWAAYVKQSLA